jgi:shikimate dehydrogenase
LFARQTGQDMQYTAQLVENGQFANAARQFFAEGGRGLNVTIPFKLDAFAFADQHTPRALKAGAVNTLALQNDQILGDNTDGVGLVTDLLHNLKQPITQKRVLVLGAGGAVRGVLQPLLDQNPAFLLLANRTASKAAQLATAFSEYSCLDSSGLDQLTGQSPFDLIINGTATSLQGEMPSLPDNLITHNSFCYDMMYSIEPTPFMRWASAHQASNQDGLGMLVEQAAAAFTLWRGVTPDTGPVIEQLRKGL